MPIKLHLEHSILKYMLRKSQKVQLNVRENVLVIRNRHFRETDIIGYKTENENKQIK